jgi:hypothetical protein
MLLMRWTIIPTLTAASPLFDQQDTVSAFLDGWLLLLTGSSGSTRQD